MNRLRIMAIVDLCLIILCFIGIVVALMIPNYPLFYGIGGFLVMLLIVGFVIRSGHKKMLEREKKEEE